MQLVQENHLSKEQQKQQTPPTTNVEREQKGFPKLSQQIIINDQFQLVKYKKIMHVKNKKIWLIQGEKKKISQWKLSLKEAQTLNLIDEYLKSTIINVLKKLKKITYKELKENIRTMYHQIENINEETEKNKNHREILKMKSTKTEIRNSLEGCLCGSAG